jgi:hypothetical protein
MLTGRGTSVGGGARIEGEAAPRPYGFGMSSSRPR